jgi:hypothetical protein
LFGGYILDVAVPLDDGIHFAGIRVDAQHAESSFGKDDRQRQAYISQAKDSNACFLGFEFLD